jgi:hypothetical protein
MQKFMSRLSGKKTLLLVPVIAFLAAGCGSSQSTNNNNQPSQQPAAAPVSNTTNISNSAAKETTAPDGSTWQGTLEKSDNTAIGSYMIMVSGHKIYLKTSRDFSTLVGKPVNVSYTGSLTNFSLDDITAQ